jgi:hypothetical protein
MAKIAFVADVHIANHRKHGGAMHVGLNHRCRAILDTLGSALSAAEDANCDGFVVCGDLFDNVRPEPQVISKTMDVLRGRELNIAIIRGNHDTVSMSEDDDALGPIDRMDADVGAFDGPAIISAGAEVSILLMPYRTGDAREWLPTELEAIAGKPNVLVLHMGIADAGTPAWMLGAHDSIEADTLFDLMDKHDIKWAVAGNWHDHKSWERNGRTIIQCGALVPTGYDNPGLEGYGSLILVDTEANTWERVEIPGPRFVMATGPGGDQYIRKCAEQCIPTLLYARWKVGPSLVGSATRMLQDMEVNLGLAGVDPALDDKAADEAARAQIQTVVASTGGWEGAVRAYVGSMELDASVDRTNVLTRTLAYLQK